LREFFPVFLHLGDSSFLPKIPSLEKMKKVKVGKFRLMQKLEGASNPEFESCGVFKIMNNTSA
jgi:hypothetical protein